MAASISETISRSVWWGWGDPERAQPLSEHAIRLLRETLQLDSTELSHPPVAESQVRVGPTTRLDDQSVDALRAIVGAEHVNTTDHERIIHSGGKSTPDLLRRRDGDALDAPDAIVFPGSTDEVAAVLAYCVAHRIAVVPFGGGTSVVGGVEPVRAEFGHLISVDLTRMTELVSIDPVSRTARFQAGIRGPAVEASLAQLGYTLGHLPQSHQEATLGGYAATRSAGQASTGYGRSDGLILGLTVETPNGQLNLGDRAPASAAGPDLLQLFLGSEGTLGIITEVMVAIVPKPTKKSYGAWAFPSFEAGVSALRGLIQDAPRGDVPEVCRLSDTDETDLTLKLSESSAVTMLRRYLTARGLRTPALAIFVWEGTDNSVAARKRRSASRLRKAGGIYVTGAPAEAWDNGRFNAPYQRDELLSRGVFVETLETAALWSNLTATHAAVRTAIRQALANDAAAGGSVEHPSHIQAHVSHLYRSGASLYYTFIARREPDPIAQYRRVKAAASTAIVNAGATITHHHAVGTEHAPYLSAEIGELGVAILAGLKGVVDPVGILNPGKLMSRPGRPNDSDGPSGTTPN